jgi:hypothetical protein
MKGLQKIYTEKVVFLMVAKFMKLCNSCFFLFFSSDLLSALKSWRKEGPRLKWKPHLTKAPQFSPTH